VDEGRRADGIFRDCSILAMAICVRCAKKSIGIMSDTLNTWGTLRTRAQVQAHHCLLALAVSPKTNVKPDSKQRTVMLYVVGEDTVGCILPYCSSSCKCFQTLKRMRRQSQ
jgi:hypothetical protein